MDGDKLYVYLFGDAIREVKDCGSRVCNYMFPEFEVHLNQLPPRAAQEWHYHRQIEEIVVVNSGPPDFLLAGRRGVPGGAGGEGRKPGAGKRFRT